MAQDDSDPQRLDELAHHLIRSKIGRLLGKAGLSSQDREDLEQEVWLRLWPRLHAYKPSKGRPHGFLSVAINRILANLVRDRFVAKRDVRRLRSLYQTVRTNEDEVEWAQPLPQHEDDVRRGRSSWSQVERADLMRDVAAVIARLPADARELARQLKHHTLSEIARRQGVPRSTLQSRVRRLRDVFDRAGLRDYL